MEYTLTLSRATAALRQHGLLLSAPHCPQELTFPALTYDSRAVAPGALFVCKGLNFKPEYLQKALEAGAACYVAEQTYDNAAPALLVSDVRRALSVLAAEYYGHPAEQLTLIGLTGTKGKTTTTYFIKNILDTALGHRTAVLSTVEMYTGGESTEAHLTTPESLELQQCFADTLAHGIRHLTMEVSSQAYKQQRVYGVPFTVGLFLNLSEDHIGPLEHESFEDYFQCKLQLMKNCKLAVICRGTDRFEEIYATAKAHAERVLVCGNDPSCDLWVENIRKETPGFTFTVCDKNSRRDFRITMEGRFNIENARLCDKMII